MKIGTRQIQGITIVDVNGQIKLGEGTAMLRDTIKGLTDKEQKQVLLNLAEVKYIDSSGIGELVSAYTSLRKQGGELKLLHLTKQAHDLLLITKLYTIFEVMDDEPTAIAAFSVGSKP